jgi:hypothetical protein
VTKTFGSPKPANHSNAGAARYAGSDFTMRLSEKTLELSITSQLTQRLNIPHAIWFGLTQRQERELGFDVASKVAGHLLILQFKASSLIVHPQRYNQPRRRFTVPHDQLVNLQAVANVFPNCVYYVFPDIGTTNELAANRDLIAQSWLLDVATLPQPFPVPANMAQTHHAFIDPPVCDIRSEPVDATLLNVREHLRIFETRERTSQKMVVWLRERDFSFRGMRAYGLLLPA